MQAKPEKSGDFAATPEEAGTMLRYKAQATLASKSSSSTTMLFGEHRGGCFPWQSRKVSFKWCSERTLRVMTVMKFSAAISEQAYAIHATYR